MGSATAAFARRPAVLAVDAVLSLGGGEGRGRDDDGVDRLGHGGRGEGHDARGFGLRERVVAEEYEGEAGGGDGDGAGGEAPLGAGDGLDGLVSLEAAV